ncbi:MAG: 16S rRNA (guanine(527)-N(7))-methyltransferase RsmG [Aeromicrobium sp.]
MIVHVSRETPPSSAAGVFADRLPLVKRYVDLLATDGVERGLIGPREAPRLWERHVLNCAVVVSRVPEDASVADVGSGAGLPGLVWALARPDLHVTLVEPLLRRTAFLQEVVEELGLDRVDVLRARADEVDETYDLVTARAVAPLEKLAGWCLPLVRKGGVLLALKGETAHEEVAASRAALHKMGATDIVVTSYGDLRVPTTVVEVTR